MKRRAVCIALALACVAGATSPAWAQPPSTNRLKGIVGTYNCVTRQAGQPIVRFTSRNTAWGAWVRADTVFPRQQATPEGNIASTFVGFDESAKRWNIVAIDKDGSYYTRLSTSRTFNASRWIDGFPADGGTAIINVVNGSRYTFDFTPKGDPKGISHTICTREP